MRNVARVGSAAGRVALLTVIHVSAVTAAARDPQQVRRLWLQHRESPGDPPAAAEQPPVTSPGLIFEVNGVTSVQVNVDPNGHNIVGDAANEPSLAVDPTRPNRLVIGWRQFDSINSNFREGGYAYSRDTGRTWKFPGVLEEGVFRSDPVLNCDANGRFFYYSLKSNFLCDMFSSPDGGKSWPSKVAAWGGDKQWFTIDRTTGPGRGFMYGAWSIAAGCCGDRTFTWSTDGGATWRTPILIPGIPYWGTMVVDEEGTLYVCGLHVETDEFIVIRSTDAKNGGTPTFSGPFVVPMGGSINGFEGPNPEGLLGQPWIDVDRSDGPRRGHLYMVSSVDPPGQDPLDVRFSRSTDGGRTWSGSIKLNSDAAHANAYQWFGTMSVAPNGRIDVFWYDTREKLQVNLSRVYYTYSTDGGETWAQDVPVSPEFNSHIGWPRQNKLGDYIQSVSDGPGVSLAYAATFNGEQDVYLMRVGDYDCNGNGVGDGTDVADGTSRDDNHNGIPDECECLGDFNGDGRIDQSDLATLLSCYNSSACGDVDGDGDTDLSDLATLLARYGETCPT